MVDLTEELVFQSIEKVGDYAFTDDEFARGWKESLNTLRYELYKIKDFNRLPARYSQTAEEVKEDAR